MLKFVHSIDQSPRLLIIESLSAVPQQGSNTLSVSMKIDAFVRTGEVGRMKLAPTAVGAEPKKLAILGAILVAGAAIYWFENRSDSPTAVSASVTPPAQTVPAVKQLPKQARARTADPAIPAPQRRAASTGSTGSAVMEDFHPSMKVKDDLDVSKIDPRIRLDLLAKVRAVPMEGGSSSLFEFSKAPEPPTPQVAQSSPRLCLCRHRPSAAPESTPKKRRTRASAADSLQVLWLREDRRRPAGGVFPRGRRQADPLTG